MKRASRGEALAALFVVCGACFAACGDTEDGAPAALGGDASSASPDGASDSTVGGDGSSTSDGGIGDGSAASDAAPEAACNADLMTDKNHCGACFHDCSKGLCAGGICTLVSGLSPKTLYGISSITEDGDRVYFTVTNATHGVHYCAKNGCVATSSTRFAQGADGGAETSPWDVAVHQGYAYWTEGFTSFTTGGAFRTPVDGGATVRVSKGDTFSQTSDIVVSDAGIWWTNDDMNERVAYCPLSLCPGAATKFPNPGSGGEGYSRAIAIADDGSIVWSENADIARCTSPTCSTGATVIASGQGQVFALAVSGATVFFGASQFDEIRSCPIAGPCPIPALVVGGQKRIDGMAVKGTRLYWTVAGTDPGDGGSTTDGIVRRCELANCAATVVDIATGEPSPYGIAVDETSVYWANLGLVNNVGKPGSVKKAPR